MNQFDIVNQAISAGREADESVFEAVAVLEERLCRLKDSSPLFCGVEISEHVLALKSHRQAVALN